MPVRVLHVGLGPIGAGIVRQVAARRGLKIVGAVDVDPAKAGRDLGRSSASIGSCASRSIGDCGPALKATSPDVVVLCTSSTLKRRAPQIETILRAQEADRVDAPRNSRIPRTTSAAWRRPSIPRRSGPRSRPWHRREPRVRDGRAADDAHRRLRAGGPDHGRPHPGCAHPPAAVPAEDRLRPDARAVPAQGGRGTVRHVGSPSRSR